MRRLKMPIILISDSLDERLTRAADIVVPVPRGQPELVALHGATFICLEAIVLGLAASERDVALAKLEKLNSMRKSITPVGRKGV
jgi:DNA-binding MurR/RpiR family transcriptional regulator